MQAGQPSSHSAEDGTGLTILRQMDVFKFSMGWLGALRGNYFCSCLTEVMEGGQNHLPHLFNNTKLVWKGFLAILANVEGLVFIWSLHRNLKVSRLQGSCVKSELQTTIKHLQKQTHQH